MDGYDPYENAEHIQEDLDTGTVTVLNADETLLESDSPTFATHMVWILVAVVILVYFIYSRVRRPVTATAGPEVMSATRPSSNANSGHHLYVFFSTLSAPRHPLTSD